MQGRDEDWMTYQAIRAAWLSFVGGRTQGEIAAEMGISSAKVHRLIAHAQKSGFVKFQIEGRPLECLQLESFFCEEFGLKRCTIAPDLGGADQSTAIRAVASAAGQVLSSLLAAPEVRRVGVGMGRTLKAAFEAVSRQTRDDLEIVSICGSLTRSLSANPYDVVQLLQARVGGEGYYLPVPYFAANEEEKRVFLSQKSVQEVMRRARQADVFIIGIGSVEKEGHLIQRGMISRDEESDLARSGAVCDLMGRFLTIDGEEASAPLGDCAVGLHFDEVKGARVIALVGGESKAAAVLAALRTGVITDLIADETLARALKKMVGSKLARTA